MNKCRNKWINATSPLGNKLQMENGEDSKFNSASKPSADPAFKRWLAEQFTLELSFPNISWVHVIFPTLKKKKSSTHHFMHKLSLILPLTFRRDFRSRGIWWMWNMPPLISNKGPLISLMIKWSNLRTNWRTKNKIKWLGKKMFCLINNHKKPKLFKY